MTERETERQREVGAESRPRRRRRRQVERKKRGGEKRDGS